MKNNIMSFLKTNSQILTLERIICRLIAAWCALTFVRSFTGNHFKLTFGQDSSLIVMGALILAFFIGFSVIAVFLKRIEIDSWIMFGFATLCVIGWLVRTDTSYVEGYLYGLSITVVYLIFVFYFMHRNEEILDKIKIGNKLTLSVAAVFAVICAVVISVVTCLRVVTFYAPNFDFGLFVNMFHNMRETGLPMSTSERDVLLSHFVVHISPIYYLILPFYYIFPSPHTLQIAQAVIVASGVIPVVMLCRSFKLSNKVTAIMAIVYSFYPAISTGSMFDIHENCFLLPLLLWTFCFFEREKYGLMYLSAFLTLMVKEDAAIYIIIFALYVILSRKKYKHGFILLCFSAVYFVCAIKLLDYLGSYYAEYYAYTTPNPPIKGAMVNRFENLILNEKDGLAGVVLTAFKNPGYIFTQLFKTSSGDHLKLKYIIQMFLPLGFIPFVTKKISRYILIVPILINLLTEYTYQYNIGYQYHYGISAFLMYVTLMNIADLKRPTKKTLISVGCISCCCLYLSSVSPYIQRYASKWMDNKDTYREMSEILATIPEDASVNCSKKILTHLAQREVVYQTEWHENEPDVDYVVLDTRDGIEQETVDAYTEHGYVITKQTDSLIIMQRAE